MHQSNKHLGNTSRHCDSRNKQHRLCIYHDCFLKCLTAVNKTHMLQLCLCQDMDKCLVLAFHIGQELKISLCQENGVHELVDLDSHKTEMASLLFKTLA